MRRVLMDFCNGLMAASVKNALKTSGDFDVFPVRCAASNLIDEYAANAADIVFLEVTYNPGATIDERLEVICRFRKTAPACKVLLMCDENSSPEIARKVAQAKRDGLIDDFVYSSVSESYLSAMMEAM